VTCSRAAARRSLAVCGLLALAAAAIAAFASELGAGLPLGLALANLREVDPGRFYRSGQLGPEQLREAIEALGLRTVINLRGYDQRPEWHVAETAVARAAGVAHHDVHLSARHLPRPREVARLLALYREAERPILVHCDSGADRAGEASALYAMEHMGWSAEQALGLLTLRYRHLAWLRPAKREFVGRYRGEAWLLRDYDPCGPDWEGSERPEICAAPLDSSPAAVGG
jgi:uncharacterized protein (TIGR01244 family)